MKATEFNNLFDSVIANYHQKDTVDQVFENPYKEMGLAQLLYRKCWIDTVQWHFEDIIRLPNINPVEALVLKRKIDASNQDRTDMVEYIDSYYLNLYKAIKIKPNATINTESPAWAIDRLSILALKIYHMKEEAFRESATKTHRESCQTKLNILLEQRQDLSKAIDDLIVAIASGQKYMKVYKQMKMYNDESLNPMLYNKK
ncbi:MAG: hypothetical protein CO023_04460 [Flavobacteriales bacterium CG_4_9_14_0_2_um_filter_35_242]|nr:DUF4254 domain-containing protein [Zetaproteobacteria bacterium]OIO13085.1 MAG: hypothetical protein AUJ53_00725 [Flavobacteriaceae bacterium CG1_02_35_72]PIR14862.1 MAG: hypothetical protein COV50_00325 [Flavobacteriales bacterium CG11_big_fil_rev_8_21_14_0_20_35_7]PIV17606.1 MAG: hypothetical protein COS42_03935 [Flavobacteriales bacterium CG03_land_8_20_14_0_80_35_15]PIX05943.1 MAG: hypothetical protein COZ76_11485 [Flavobacteriales bacterium CG_4_8_14_3_um_filter_35_10]PJA06059.1 MAG: h